MGKAVEVSLWWRAPAPVLSVPGCVHNVYQARDGQMSSSVESEVSHERSTHRLARLAGQQPRKKRQVFIHDPR